MNIKMCRLFFIALIICLCFRLTIERCKVEKVDKSKLHKVNLYNEEEVKNLRNLQDTTWLPIRIFVDYTHLDEQKNSQVISNDLYSNIKSIMEATVTAYESLILINRPSGRLAIPNCNELKLSEDIQNDGVDADTIMIPFVNIEAGANIEASASYCVQESSTGRPVAGSVGFGTSLDFSKVNSKYYYILLTLHEMNHVLSFHSELFNDFIDPTTGQKYVNGVTTEMVVNGDRRTMVTTPKVLAAAKKHFGCDNLKGVELENQGGEGTEGSHWEERVMLGDYMIGESYDEVVISEISLALFEDSGWYKVNYYTGGLFRFGKNGGCDFVSNKCIQNGSTLFANEFAVAQRQPMCFGSRTGKGMSSLQKQSAPLEQIYRYWTDPNEGGQQLADYCPVAASLTSKGTWYGNHCNIGKSSYPAGLFETIGPNSYCFISNLTADKDSTITSYKNIARTICHAVTCHSDTKSYTVTIGTSSATCPKEGGTVNVDGFNGSIICPDYNRICTKSMSCSDTLDCITKKSTPLENSMDYTPVPPTQTIAKAGTSSSGSSSSTNSGSSSSTNNGSSSTTGSSITGGLGGLTGGKGNTSGTSGTSGASGSSTDNQTSDGGIIKEVTNPLSKLFEDTPSEAYETQGSCVSFFGLACGAANVKLYMWSIILIILFSLL
jgi:hypothetical protein